MGGTPNFAATRVPIHTLLDYLEAGRSIDGFLVGFPTVKRKQIIPLLSPANIPQVISQQLPVPGIPIGLAVRQY